MTFDSLSIVDQVKAIVDRRYARRVLKTPRLLVLSVVRAMIMYVIISIILLLENSREN
jgi:hypothetical protein